MVSHLVVYQLMLIALLWVFLMLSCVWPSEPAAARPLPPTPVTPPRKRSTAPKPFPGLLRQPHCDACAQAVASHREPPCAPSPRLISTRGRRRQVDTSRHFCPDPDCRYGGWLGLGNITSNGHPSGGPWRQLHCTACESYFLETHGTPLHKHVLAACGWQINTAFIERVNLSIRQHVAAVGRRVTTLCKHEAGVRQQLALYHVYYNFCLPHASLRLPLPQSDAVAAVRTHPCQRLGQAVAAPDTSHGGGAHRPCLDAARGAALPRATVATASAGVRKREPERERRIAVS